MNKWGSIVSFLKSRGMNQSQIGRELGVSHHAVHSWLHLYKIPRKETREKLLKLASDNES